MQRDDLLVWIDLEMTGLEPRKDKITEIATVITDSNLNAIAEGLDIVIHVDEPLFTELLEANPDYRKYQFEDEVRASSTSTEEAEKQTLDFIKEYISPQSSPLCGNSIYVDRFFLKLQMPKLNNYFHYRNVDVSSIKELARRWNPELFVQTEGMKKKNHRAKDDILESIEELKFYKDNFFKI